jgi:methionine-rich copper-binding protein CopC
VRLLLAGVLVLALAPAAEGHGRLVRSVPAAGSVATAPSEIRLTFDAGVLPALSGATIAAAAGEWAVPAAAVTGDGTQVVVPLPAPLAAGVVRVRWHVVTEDMHKVEGEFAFEVAP